MAGQVFRIFISSPSDVFAERERVERVITRLNGEFGGGLLQAIRWERAYYTAAKTFQDQIPLPSETDLVICILWKRLGFELPPDYRRADGTTPTGTEYEFEDAMQAARAKGTPDVLVYRKAAPVLLDAEQVEVERAQFEALKTFWGRWFRSETGHFTAAYQSFDNTDAFETLVEDHIRQWLLRHKVAATGVAWPIEQRGSPFRGLQPFDAGHAAVFFGRRRVLERARERLSEAGRRGTGFLLILGTSGSGKSSLARAGLLPRLVQPGAVPGVDLWRCCVLRPGEAETPLLALARALYRDGLPELAEGDSPAPPDFAALLAAAPEAAARAIGRALGRATAAIAAREAFGRPVEARLLLLVDQFEEALTPPATRDGFAAALAALVAGGLVWVVATLRSDLYAPFQASPGLVALRDGGSQLDLLPPAAAELAEIVSGPAAAAGLTFDTRDGVGLDEALVAAADQPGALPLLQLTLDALFEARDPAANVLTFAAYDALGGLPGVVERRAEATLAALDPAAVDALPAVLRALVEVTEDGIVTGRAAVVDATPEGQRLVDAFVAARLLVADTQGEATRLRVAHDALLSGWPRAAAAIAADREALRTRGRVSAAAHRWAQEARHPDLLLPPGRPLAEAAELFAHRPEMLEAGAQDFVAASQAADAARRAAAEALGQRELRLQAEAQQARADAATRIVRRTRVAVAAVSVLLLAASGAALYANQQRREAQAQTARAERNFQSALDGGASLVAAVNAHLADGGMTRRVARELLDTADAGIGSLLPRGEAAALPPALLDTQARLQVSFSRVLVAVCDGGEARARAQQALTTAEAADRQAPADARAQAVVTAMHALGRAAEAESDWAGAQKVFERAEALAASHTGDGWKPLLQMVRRDLAFTISDAQRDHAVALLRDDLAWEQAQPPGDPAVLAREATDERSLAYVARMAHDFPAALAGMEREAALLHRLAEADPYSLEWQRALTNNALQRAIVRQRQGDAAGSLALLREAAAGSAVLLAHDPGNALWLIGKLSVDLNLAIHFLRAGDAAAGRAVLLPDLAAVKALEGGGAANRVCRTEAAQLQSGIGNALVVLGSGPEGIAALEASLALARTLAESAPADPALARGVVEAEVAVARAMLVAGQSAGAARHARAGIAAAADAAMLSQLRELLGDALANTGDTAGAVAAFEADRDAAAALVAADPGNAAARNQMATSLLRIANVQGMAGHADAQAAALHEAEAAMAPLAGRADLPVAWQRTLIDLRQQLGTAAMGRDHAAGLEHLRAALALAEALAKQAPDDGAARRAPIQTLMLLAAAYRIDGQTGPADAAEAQRQALQAALPALN